MEKEQSNLGPVSGYRVATKTFSDLKFSLWYSCTSREGCYFKHFTGRFLLDFDRARYCGTRQSLSTLHSHARRGNRTSTNGSRFATANYRKGYYTWTSSTWVPEAVKRSTCSSSVMDCRDMYGYGLPSLRQQKPQQMFYFSGLEFLGL